ncbi:MAG TPA: rhodanese-like domain-containing protein [Solirubrobacterales bacterium]|nr:rhodanese-like domain-containing protein [Solirubrobacterales bacterium]
MGEVRQVSREEAQKLIAEGAQVLDVRDEHEWEAGHIAGAAHIPLPQLNERAGEIDPERPVILYCRGGTRCEMATEALEAAGYDAAKLTGGIVGWAEEDLPIEPAGGYVAESGKAASVLQSRKLGSSK